MEKTCGGSDLAPLPQEIIYNILLRLPRRSLCRFMSVSKLWLAIISDPQFISSYFNRCSAHRKLLLTVPEVCYSDGASGKCIFSLDYSECQTEKISQNHQPVSLTVTSHGVIHRRRPSETLVSHSSGGLVCIEFDKVLVVCNPSTREAITLPRLPACGDSKYINHFGFDPVENKYKILSTVDLGGRGDRFRVYVITLGEEKWRRLNGGYPASDLGTDFSTQVQLHGASVCVDGVIYYLSHTRSMKRIHLIAFDVQLETFKVIPFPADVRVGANAFLMESDGCVALVEMIYDCYIRKGVDYLDESRNRPVIPYPPLDPEDDNELFDELIDDSPDEEIFVHTLKDVQNQIWVSESFPVPGDLGKLIQTVILVGTTHKGELLYATSMVSGKSNLYVCNLKDSCLTQIEVDGLPKRREYPYWVDQLRVCNHVENAVSLKNFSTNCKPY